jgi:transcription elongation factor Elf1
MEENPVSDKSYLDEKYFIDDKVFNCPYCNRRNVLYKVENHLAFDWSNDKICNQWIVKCTSCGKRSMHLSFNDLTTQDSYGIFRSDINLDDYIFYSVPTSFFVIDNRYQNIT